MNKEELLKEISKTEEHLATMKKMLEECKYERWKPKDYEVYWYVNSRGESCCSHFCLAYKTDIDRYQNFNCFQTHEQAQAEAEKTLVRRQLEDIARRLNKGKKIDWFDGAQYKFCITEHFTKCSPQSLELQSWTAIKTEGTVYCLSEDFLDVAIREIGEERLRKYLKGE